MDTYALTSADSTASIWIRTLWGRFPAADVPSATSAAYAEADTSSPPKLPEPAGGRATRYDAGIQPLLFDHDLSLEELDELGDKLYDEISRGRALLLPYQLLGAVKDPEVIDERKALALELVASTKRSWLEDEVVEALLQSLQSPSSELRFAAIASAGFLSRSKRLAIRGAVMPLTREQAEADEEVRAAATAFLRRS